MSRLPSEERKRRILEVMAGMASRARHRGDFTAAKVALACGVSSTLLYRLASAEFQAYRAGLPGAPTDLALTALRTRLHELTTELERSRGVEVEHARCPSRADVAQVLDRNEELEEENRSLRVQLEHLRRVPTWRPNLRSLEDPP